jgi:hypothetical protein
MATVTFNVPTELINKLTDSQTAIGQFLIGVFDLSAANKQLVCEQLLAFHDDVGGSPEVETFNIAADEVTYNPKTQKGKVTFRYRVRFYYGCADINKDEPATEKADFEVDTSNNKLTVHIHDPIRRGTVDEF